MARDLLTSDIDMISLKGNKLEQQSKSPTTETKRQFEDTKGAESELKAVIEGINAAFRARDLNKLKSFYAKDVVAYDMPTPLSFKGIDSYLESWKTALDMMSDMGPFETAEDKYFVGQDIGIYHALCRMTGTLTKNNEKIDSWARYTGVFKKSEGKWLIVHEHFSVPIDMEKEKPAWNLKPESASIRH